MRIEVVEAPENPSRMAMAVARTCYSQSPVRIGDLSGKSDEQVAEFCLSLFGSGHFTTLMHQNYTLLIEGVSRHLVWDLLHRVRFYNTEQVSQRYTRTSIADGGAYIPRAFNREYQQKVDRLCMSLYLSIERIYGRIVELMVERGYSEKTAFEDARYIMPISVFTNLYYTVNLMTIVRLRVATLIEGATHEEKDFGDLLEKEVLSHNKDLSWLFEEARGNAGSANITKEHATPKSVDGVRLDGFIRGMMEDDARTKTEVVEPMGIDFGLGNGLLESVMLQFSQCISFSADCQEQRHRTLSRIAPDLSYSWLTLTNAYVPETFSADERGLEMEAVKLTEQVAEQVRHYSNEWFLLMPNCHRYTTIQGGTLEAFARKWEQRLCMNAQTETRRINEEQFRIASEIVGISSLGTFGPPCAIRKACGQLPLCKEGKRTCLARGEKEPWSRFQGIGLSKG